MPTWDLSAYRDPAAKPALAHTPSRRRAQQLRFASRAEETPTAPHATPDSDPHTLRAHSHDGDHIYPGAPLPFPRQHSPDHSDVENLAGKHEHDREACAPRTVRRKKSSFDLRDLFLNGPGPMLQRPASDVSEMGP
ncbi:hypothetical protein C2E23DRAFT_881797 [Lenzites betulinus]|nr:hypothetical protein C2E23DRAFT_881797 [Lenzites betulinus]